MKIPITYVVIFILILLLLFVTHDIQLVVNILFSFGVIVTLWYLGKNYQINQAVKQVIPSDKVEQPDNEPDTNFTCAYDDSLLNPALPYEEKDPYPWMI